MAFRLDGLLSSREYIACGRRTRYVLRTRDSELHPSRVHALKHFFGRSSLALRDAELLERFRPPCSDSGQRHRDQSLPGCADPVRFAVELGYDVTVVKDATADYSEEFMHAALVTNLPNYASAIVITSEMVEAISALERAA